MIRHVVQCETCPASFDFEPLEHPAHRDIPAPWLAVFTHGPMQGQEGRHFCSHLCLRTWLLGNGTSERKPLTAEQRRVLDTRRSDVHDYLVATTQLFEQEHPELKLIWSFRIVASIRAGKEESTL